MTENETPRIYVASLADYNAGRLVGTWIDLEEGMTADDVQEAVDAMLTAATMSNPAEGVREEWAIHDHEGWQGIRVGEWESFATLCEWADMLHQHGAAFAAWVDNDPSADVSDFPDAYRGEWESFKDYAEELATDLGAFKALRDAGWSESYFDVDQFARDLLYGGVYWTADTGYGPVYVFDNHA